MFVSPESISENEAFDKWSIHYTFNVSSRVRILYALRLKSAVLIGSLPRLSTKDFGLSTQDIGFVRKWKRSLTVHEVSSVSIPPGQPIFRFSSMERIGETNHLIAVRIR